MKTRIPAPAGFKGKYLKGQEAIAALPLCGNGSDRYAKDLMLPDGDKNAMRVSVSWDSKIGAIRHSICAPWLLADVFSI